MSTLLNMDESKICKKCQKISAEEALACECGEIFPFDKRVFDLVGQEITPGCFIAYAISESSSASLSIGKVIKAETIVAQRYGHPYRKTILQVQGARSHYSTEPHLLSKPSTLQYPKNTVVLKKEGLSKEWLKLYEDV